MKRNVLLVLAATIVLSFTSGLAKGKRYSIEALTIQALVEPDGDLAVRESIRYRFRGAFSFAFRDIPLKPGESIANIVVGEDGSPYQSSTDKRPGTFRIESRPEGTRVTWYYRARSETRTFHFSYVLAGVVKRHPDTAELNFQFVGDGWDHPIGQVHAEVRFAESPPINSVRAWAHGPLNGRVLLSDDGRALFDVAPLPARTFWEGRILFPGDMVGTLPVSQRPALARILAEEQAWSEKANQLRQEQLQAERDRAALAEQLLPWSILAAVFGVSLWTLLYFLYGKEYSVHPRHVPGELPSPHPPALVGYLLHRSVGAAALAATLIDLSRRGFVRIIEKERDSSNLLGRKRTLDYRLELTGQSLDGLAGFEKELLVFLLQSCGDGDGVWLKDFKRMAQRKRSVTRWFRKWRKQVSDLGKREHFFEPFSGRVLALNIGAGVAIAVFGGLASLGTASPVGVPAVVVGVIQAALSATLSRRTPEGRELQLAWMAFKRHLKSIARAQGPVSLRSENMSRFLVASVLLGMHRDFARLLETTTSRDSSDVFAWYVPHAGHPGQGLSGLTGGLSSLVSSVGSAMSSAAGAGGGASVGGGAGSGGGGGGAG